MEEANKNNTQPIQNREESPEVEAKEGSAPDAIRPELNLEKWPAIWRPAKSNRAPVVRSLQREVGLKNGSRVTAKVELGFTHLGELTTEDQRTYYALVKQWEIARRQSEHTFFSIRGLARLLKKKWGTNVIDSVTESLRRLRTAPFTWQNSYFDGTQKGTIEEIDTFTILSELKLIRQKTDGRVTKEAGYFRFNDLTLRNLLVHHTKPVLFDTILQFRSEIAQLLYTHIDLIMSDKRQYERRSRELCEDLGLHGTEYGRLNRRKITLERALIELQGAPISTGVISYAGLEKTQDGKDYKVVFVKSSRVLKRARPVSRGDLTLLTARQTPIEHQAQEVVLHFHKLFHNVSHTHLQSKAITQAVSLIAQHGFERAKYLVDFSHQAAAKTNYAPQTFGGILQYTGSAIAAYEDNQRKIEAARAASKRFTEQRQYDELQNEITRAKYQEAEARLDTLPEEERAALYAKAKEATARHSWITPTSMMFEKTIRREMVAELMRQNPSGESREPPATHTS